MAVCLVTGGAGFIGSHLVEALVKRRHSVRVLDNFTTGKRANLEQVLNQIELIAGDVSDLKTAHVAMRGVDCVFHLASTTGSSEAPVDPLLVHHGCATGTLHILEAAREAQVRRIIHTSTAAVYGQDDDLPRCETDPTRPHSLYASAKLAAEHYCLEYSRLYGLETVRLRYFEVFGPRQPVEGCHSSILARFLHEMQRGHSPVIFGDGAQTRDFTNVEDVIQANLLAAEAPRVSGKLYNIASGQATSLLELVTLANKVLGTHIKPIHNPLRMGEPRHSRASIVRAQTELGFCPYTNLPSDLGRCVARVPENPVTSAPAALEDRPVGAGIACYRLDGPALMLANSPHHWRDRTFRIR
jgi:UDP-glucose 4-epimerase